MAVKKRHRYKPIYAEKLIEHRSKGYSFNSFAAEIDEAQSTIKQWLKNREFARAAEIAKSKALHFWETIGINAVQGNLKAIKSEKILSSIQKDKDGRDVRDSNGKVVVQEEIIEREFEKIPLKDSIYIFNMKAQFRWDDRGTDFADEEDAEGGPNATRAFLLSYSLQDKAHKVVDRQEAKGPEPA